MAKVLTIVDLNKSGKTLVLPSDALPASDENIAKLKQGAYIKVGLAGDDYPKSPVEYCWAEFIKSNKDTGLIEIIINNDLVLTHLHCLDDGDKLEIKPENVLAILY
jgi:hypothetical protein